MAAAELKLEVTCSICTEIYTNPVTLKCGHSFCQDCIKRTFDNQYEREYFCPECMAGFTRRPELKKNPRLSNIADHFHSVEPNFDNPKNVCSYCIHSPVSAVTLCLHCDTFLCDVHKQTHNKSSEHVLADLTTSLEDRKCPIHHKILEYYCTVDGICICVDCLTSDHNGHRVSTKSELLQQQTNNLKPILETLSNKREETIAMVQSLLEYKMTVYKGADGLEESITAIMGDIRRQQDDLEKRLLADISKQKQQITISASNRIQELEKKKTELQKKITQIEGLSKNTNLILALQTPDVLFHVLEDECHLDRGMGIITTQDTCYLEESVIFDTLYSELSNIMGSAKKDVHVKDAQTLSAAYDNLNIGYGNVSKSQKEANAPKLEATAQVQSPSPPKAQNKAIAKLRQNISLISGNKAGLTL